MQVEAHHVQANWKELYKENHMGPICGYMDGNIVSENEATLINIWKMI